MRVPLLHGLALGVASCGASDRPGRDPGDSLPASTPPTATPAPPPAPTGATVPPSTDPTTEGTTVEITEEYWDAAASCWTSRTLTRPSSAWPDPCDFTVDTGPRWGSELWSDADGNCARLPVNCTQTDAFFGPCADVVGCCDASRLTASLCQ